MINDSYLAEKRIALVEKKAISERGSWMHDLESYFSLYAHQWNIIFYKHFGCDVFCEIHAIDIMEQYSCLTLLSPNCHTIIPSRLLDTRSCTQIGTYIIMTCDPCHPNSHEVINILEVYKGNYTHTVYYTKYQYSLSGRPSPTPRYCAMCTFIYTSV